MLPLIFFCRNRITWTRESLYKIYINVYFFLRLFNRKLKTRKYRVVSLLTRTVPPTMLKKTSLPDFTRTYISYSFVVNPPLTPPHLLTWSLSCGTDISHTTHLSRISSDHQQRYSLYCLVPYTTRIFLSRVY